MKLDDVQHLLPESAQALVRLIGLADTVKLVDVLGGTTFPVSLRRNRLGEIRYEMLAEVVGVDAANKLTDHFGGDMMYIPLCKAALRELLQRSIREEFDEITRAYSALHAVSVLAAKHRLCDRTVWRILKRQDNTPGAGGSEYQGRLF
ncbi:Mor transcription activator family protein [Chromobacterium subtsugae]|uniref:Mor transcription activator family protein n=1 Tax=Chromobacterium subtsugae TaxID=251747 RepID=UPI000640FB58|nr:Mor transcription activator family protein [Chromobacterium subtsugae]